jgi:hypothetical protein
MAFSIYNKDRGHHLENIKKKLIFFKVYLKMISNIGWFDLIQKFNVICTFLIAKLAFNGQVT